MMRSPPSRPSTRAQPEHPVLHAAVEITEVTSRDDQRGVDGEVSYRRLQALAALVGQRDRPQLTPMANVSTVAAFDRPGRQLLRPVGDARISMTDARDVAAVTARGCSRTATPTT
jgi:hypothetical protein